jgi:acylphosphatase
MTTASRLEIFGRVQGVGFRAFVLRQARQHDLRGWVRNRQDGSVEALLIGEDGAIAAVQADCRLGPAAAQVDRVDTFPAQDDGSAHFLERQTV